MKVDPVGARKILRCLPDCALAVVGDKFAFAPPGPGDLAETLYRHGPAVSAPVLLPSLLEDTLFASWEIHYAPTAWQTTGFEVALLMPPSRKSEVDLFQRHFSVSSLDLERLITIVADPVREAPSRIAEACLRICQHDFDAFLRLRRRVKPGSKCGLRCLATAAGLDPRDDLRAADNWQRHSRKRKLLVEKEAAVEQDVHEQSSLQPVVQAGEGSEEATV